MLTSKTLKRERKHQNLKHCRRTWVFESQSLLTVVLDTGVTFAPDMGSGRDTYIVANFANLGTKKLVFIEP
jgi:hypothetical protein